MQVLDSFYETAIKHGHVIEGLPLAVAEWNFNHILDPLVTNEGSTAIDDPDYPIDSVADGVRPYSSGIMQALTDEAWTTNEGEFSPDANRYYTVVKNDVYKYWVSRTRSMPSMPDDFPINEYSIDDGVVLITYPQACRINKVKAIFNLGAKPVDWKIEIYNTVTSSWMTISDPVINDITGKSEYWWNGSAWTTTQQLSESVYISADKIRLTVNSIDQPSSFFHLVEFAMGREIDITPRMISYDVDQNMDEQDFMRPIGTVSSSTGSIIIDNSDLAINRQTASDYAGLLNGWCLFRTYVKYDLSGYGGGIYIAQTGSMYTNDWKQVNEFQYSVELFDIIKIIQNTKTSPLLFENVSIAEIVGTILDNAGVNSYAFEPTDFSENTIVKYFWVDGKETVYEALRKLCNSHQAAVFSDESGIIKLLTKGEIANEEDDPLWTFRGHVHEDILPDIITLSKKYNLQANEVTINYKNMMSKIDDRDVTEQRLKSQLWDSTDTIVLRAAPLLKTLPETGTEDIYLTAEQAEVWPYKSRVNIDGEIIEYDGKGYLVWDFSGSSPSSAEVIITSADQKRTHDIASYQSYLNSVTANGALSMTAFHNKYTGRIKVKTRDSESRGNQQEHSTGWKHGWMGWNVWAAQAGNPAHPGKYVEYGATTPGFEYANLKNVTTKPTWTVTNYRWSTSGSVLTGDASFDGKSDNKIFALLNDLGDTEYREFGTRFRFSGGNGDCGCILLYLSNATGYDTVNPPTTDPYDTNRCYIINFKGTEATDLAGRNSVFNEVLVQVKNGDTLTTLPSSREYGGQVQLLKNQWYDIDVVFRDGYGYDQGEGFWSGQTAFEIFINGQYLDTWFTSDSIRPTSLVGLGARHATKIDYEYFYATSTTNVARSYYKNSDNYDFNIINMPSGTNITKRINLATDGPRSSKKVLSFVSNAACTINSVKVFGGVKYKYTSSILMDKIKTIGPFNVAAQRRQNIFLDEMIDNPMAVEIQYTSTQDVSMCVEYSSITNEPYRELEAKAYPYNTYYDILKNGYASGKADGYIYQPNNYSSYSLSHFAYVSASREQDEKFFYDDFGSFMHEIRDFDVELDNSPAKAVQVYSSNPKIKVMSLSSNPIRGVFSMVNASHRNEIANGTEEVTDSDSIDHSLILYGYVLEDKGDKNKIVKNESSIRKYGNIPIEITADWIFDDVEAEKLSNWIVEHWSEPMDTIELVVFSNTFSQIGDKVNIAYLNVDIEESWLYIVSDISRGFDENGLSSKLTLRRVR